MDSPSFAADSKYYLFLFAAENIKEAILEMIEDWGLSKDKLVCVTSDAASNMIKAAELAGWRRLSCVGHGIHNGVNTGLRCDAKINDAITACRSVSYPILPVHN